MTEKKQDVVVLVGAGGIGLAIARRVATGRKLLITNLTQEETDPVVELLRGQGFDVEGMACDLGSRESIVAVRDRAVELGDVTHVICAAGVSPSQAPIEVILKVDLYGTSVLLEEFGKVVAPGGSGIVISSQSGHRLPALSLEQNFALATTPTEELLALDFLQPEAIGTTLHAYQYAKRCNVLRVAAQACEWGKRGTRVNSVSPGIIMTPLAYDEINGPRGEGYRTMIGTAPAGRAGTVDEIGDLCAYLMSDKAGFISGIDVLADGGCTAAYWYGDLQYLQENWANS